MLAGCVGAAALALLLVALLAWLFSGLGPPNGDAFRPLPAGVDIVGERDWCARDETVYRYGFPFRAGMCVHEIDVRRPGASGDQLRDELAAHYRDVTQITTDTDRLVVLGDQPGVVTLVDGTAW